MGDVVMHITDSLSTYEDASPRLHIAVVCPADGHYFTVAWQASMRHNDGLKHKRRMPTPPAPDDGPSHPRYVFARAADEVANEAHEEALRLARAAAATEL